MSSADGFQLVTIPSTVLLMTASSDDATTAASNCSVGKPRPLLPSLIQDPVSTRGAVLHLPPHQVLRRRTPAPSWPLARFTPSVSSLCRSRARDGRGPCRQHTSCPG